MSLSCDHSNGPSQDPTASFSAPQDPSSCSPSRILVVDDDPSVRVVLVRMLLRAGYRVSCANDGEQAWLAFTSEPFDLLITDHKMPGLLGLDLIRRIRAQACPTPVILISGDMPWHEFDVNEIILPGLFLEKPFSNENLLENVRRFLLSQPKNQGSSLLTRPGA